MEAAGGDGMNDQNGNHDFNLSKSFATDIYVATKMVFAGGRNENAETNILQS